MDKEIDQRSVIKLMHVDDSAIVRRMVTGFFKDVKNVEVIATAQNGQEAIDLLDKNDPDVIILDIEMPEMDGITALPKILEKKQGVKVVMCSTLTERGAAITMKAFSLGAVECIAKPTAASDSENKFGDFRENILRTVKGLFPEKMRYLAPHIQAEKNKLSREDKTAALLRAQQAENKQKSFDPKAKEQERELVKRIESKVTPTPEYSEDASFSLNTNRHAYTGKPEILAIGSSTGGPQALFQVLKDLKGADIPIVITQHMPPTFTTLLAQHIEQNTGIPSHEGQDGQIVENNHIYVAPGGYHMLFKRNETGQTQIVLDDGPQINYCKPAVDPMFESLVRIYGRKILGVILTGMGHDGLMGSKLIVHENGRIISQDKETSTVWGMPRAVTLANICSEVLPLSKIGPWLRSQVI